MHEEIMHDENTDPENTNTEPRRYLCRHIFTDGHRCGSICLRGEHFCYYHHTTRRPAANPQQRRGRRTTFDIPLPEDRSAIQATIGMVLQRIAANNIDPRRASLLLYGLSIATSNLPKAAPPSRNSRSTPQPEGVEEITTHPELGTLAPTAEFNPPQEKLSLAGYLLAELRKEPCACKKKPTPHQESETDHHKPTILPTLNAAAENQTISHISRLTPETQRHNGRGRNRQNPRRNKRATLFELPMDLSRN